MTEIEIMNEVREAKVHLENLGYNVAFVGIYGSQNYGLAEYSEDYMSDVDLKAVIVPSLDDIIYQRKPVSTTIEFKDGQIDVKDIRKFTDTLVKCNPAYVETLYTPYSIYTDDYKAIINEREQLVSEMGVFFLKASYGMIMEKIKAFDHPYPSIKNKIDKFGYDPKQLHHIVRLEIMMGNFIKTGCFDMSNSPLAIKALMDIKKGVNNKVDATAIMKLYDGFAKALKDGYNVEPKFNAKERIQEYSRTLIKNRIVEAILKPSKKPLVLFNSYCSVCGQGHDIPDFDAWTNCSKCKTSFKPLPF